MCPVCVTGLYTFPSLIRKQSFAPTGVVLRFPPSFTLPQYRNLFLSPDIPPVFAALCTFVVMGRDLFLLFITQKPPSHVFVEEAFIIWTCGRSAPSDFCVLAFVLTSSEMDVGLHGWGPPPNTDDVPRVRCSREAVVFQVHFLSIAIASTAPLSAFAPHRTLYQSHVQRLF